MQTADNHASLRAGLWFNCAACFVLFFFLHVCMCKGVIFFFHQIHPDDLCRPPPLRTTAGPAPGSGSIVLHVCICKGMIFVFHQIRPDDLCRPPPVGPRLKEQWRTNATSGRQQTGRPT
jgi:hypothetical protein